MRMTHFLQDQTGTVTVDWSFLTAAAGVMALTAAGLLTVATNGFTEYNVRELALREAGGLADRALGYLPADADLFDTYVEGLDALDVAELDALAGYANRLWAAGVPDMDDEGAATLAEFVAAVDAAYAARGLVRPTHTRIDTARIGHALGSMGLSHREIAALMPA
ncbi:hypothetical protein [Jannaschia sp. W003]|uniref:hypothetical protein n=1 Tax=Jannaschia sp. W003 TaxID=2867012 RepID=UPI0021A67C9F|nr:hypothetical protein [Jannaschia sp. W003]UWQ22747.1 hypothetical protein K3554_06900 [Jannaschia sp. W003]